MYIHVYTLLLYNALLGRFHHNGNFSVPRTRRRFLGDISGWNPGGVIGLSKRELDN